MVLEGPPGKPARRPVQQDVLELDTQLSRDAGIHPWERSASTTRHRQEDSRGWIPSKRNLSDTDSCPFPGERTAAAWRTHDEALHGEGHSARAAQPGQWGQISADMSLRSAAWALEPRALGQAASPALSWWFTRGHRDTHRTHFTAHTLPFQNTLGPIFTHTMSPCLGTPPLPGWGCESPSSAPCSPSWRPGQVSALRVRASAAQAAAGPEAACRDLVRS